MPLYLLGHFEDTTFLPGDGPFIAMLILDDTTSLGCTSTASNSQEIAPLINSSARKECEIEEKGRNLHQVGIKQVDPGLPLPPKRDKARYGLYEQREEGDFITLSCACVELLLPMGYLPTPLMTGESKDGFG
eukprot:Gb_24469 [translate_table: standard]